MNCEKLNTVPQINPKCMNKITDHNYQIKFNKLYIGPSQNIYKYVCFPYSIYRCTT